jgi:glycosyltransferase involved in cell wall biosynthesis
MFGRAPRVSVIIPAYEARAFIGDAVRSVLAQPCGVELIVVDDGSTDGTADEAASFGDAVRLIRSARNAGLPSALNRGLERARGDIVGFLDADDVWPPGRLGAEIALLASTPTVDVLWGRTRIVFLDGVGGEGEVSPAWPPRHYPALGSMLFRRRVFERVGQFDQELRHAHDTDFLAKAQEAAVVFRRHEDVVLTWRRHAANMTNNVRLDRDYLAIAVRRALHRRRATRCHDTSIGRLVSERTAGD